MFINKIRVINFRLLKDTVLDMREEMSLLIGRNNSGKTSFLVLFEKFYKSIRPNFDDFSLSIRNKIKNITEDTDINELTIKMIIEIKYGEKDDLRNLCNFILDLDPAICTTNILFECYIDKTKLINALTKVKDSDKERFLEKELTNYLQFRYYVFSDIDDLESENRHRLVETDISEIRNLINFQIIHAKRDVASSEENNQNKRILSSLTNKYFNNNNNTGELNAINEQMIEMDSKLDNEYESFFGKFLSNAKDFLAISDLKVVSNIQSNELLKYTSKVVYGDKDSNLPENLNGLGYLNILYLLLTIEIKKENFYSDGKDINLLFIEEPEAHTHPQMQYIFARKIKRLLKDINNLQTVITTHSSHIVSECDFEDIRYLMKENIDEKFQKTVIKNFYQGLKKMYDDKQQFKFIKQYLTIQSAELFFSDKVIFIEGTTEKVLLPYFINKYDQQFEEESYIPIASQNISILEVGANAKAFLPFLEFLNIRGLIITDIDTTKASRDNKSNRKSYKACEVRNAENTSNETLKTLFDAPKIESAEFSGWLNNLIKGKIESKYENLKAVYQTEENGYHGRSFEDAFLNVNLEYIKSEREELWGLKNKGKLDEDLDVYNLTETILDKKSDFAASLLYKGLSDESFEWKTPSYLKEGLDWIVQ